MLPHGSQVIFANPQHLINLLQVVQRLKLAYNHNNYFIPKVSYGFIKYSSRTRAKAVIHTNDRTPLKQPLGLFNNGRENAVSTLEENP